MIAMAGDDAVQLQVGLPHIGSTPGKAAGRNPVGGHRTVARGEPLLCCGTNLVAGHPADADPVARREGDGDVDVVTQGLADAGQVMHRIDIHRI